MLIATSFGMEMSKNGIAVISSCKIFLSCQEICDNFMLNPSFICLTIT